jgi:hypothetical protein
MVQLNLQSSDKSDDVALEGREIELPKLAAPVQGTK